MGKKKVATERGDGAGVKTARPKVRYGNRNGEFVWLPPNAKTKKKKKKKLREEEGDGTKLPGKLTSGDLDSLLELGRVGAAVERRSSGG